MDSMAVISVMIVVYAVVGILILIPAIVLYILRGIGLADVARRTGGRVWPAWVPFFWVLSASDAAGEIRVGRLNVKRAVPWLPWIRLVCAVFALIGAGAMMGWVINMVQYGDEYFYTAGFPFPWSMLMIILASLFGMVAELLSLIVLHRLYLKFVPRNADLYVVLGYFINILPPIFMFMLKSKPVVPPETGNDAGVWQGTIPAPAQPPASFMEPDAENGAETGTLAPQKPPAEPDGPSPDQLDEFRNKE